MRWKLFLSFLVFFSIALYADSKPTLIELGTRGCIRSRLMKEVIAKIREKYGDQINVEEYDIYFSKEGNELLHKYEPFEIPAQIILDKNGREIYRHIGYIYFEDLENLLKKLKLVKSVC